MKKHVNIFSIISFLLAITVLVACLMVDLSEIKDLGSQVREIKNAEAYADGDYYWGGNGLLVRNSFRFQGYGEENTSRADLYQFLSSTTTLLYYAFCSSAAFFSILVTVVGSYFIKSRLPQHRFLIPICALAVFILLFGITAVVWFSCGLPVPALSAAYVLGGICSALAVIASSLFISFLFSRIGTKILVWFLVMILLAVSYFAGFISKEYLWSPKYEPSFAYVGEIDSRFGEEDYLGLIEWNEDGTMTFDGKNYEPELIPNKNHASGISFILYFVLELLNPAAGVYLNMIMPLVLESYSAIAAGYTVHAVLWVVSAAVLNKRDKAAGPIAQPFGDPEKEIT